MSVEKLQAVYRTAVRVAPDATKQALGGRSLGDFAEGEIPGLMVRLEGILIRHGLRDALDAPPSPQQQAAPSASAAKPAARPSDPFAAIGRMFGVRR